MMKKILAMGLSIIMTVSTSICVWAVGEPVLSITAATATTDGTVSIDGTIENEVSNQQLTVMASEYINDTYDVNSISYIDQISCTGIEGKFRIEFNPKSALEKEKVYIVRMGGTDIESAVYMILKTDADGDVEWIYGDVDKDGVITASDAAVVLQYVLNSASIGGIAEDMEDFLKRADVTGEGIITSEQASYIYQKVLNSSFKFPVEE